MRGNKTLIAALMLSVAIASSSAYGGSMKRSEETMTLKGSVGVLGNAPFTFVALAVPPLEGKGPPVDYAVQGPLAQELRKYQGRTVTLQCRRCETGPNMLPCVEPLKILVVE